MRHQKYIFPSSPSNMYCILYNNTYYAKERRIYGNKGLISRVAVGAGRREHCIAEVTALSPDEDRGKLRELME